MTSLVIRGGTLLDGTGTAPHVTDVVIDGGRIVGVGPGGHGGRVLDASGLMVAPGFVDAHTHYDAQLRWDPSASPSGQHGVTSVICGNCGFTLAPLRSRDADYTRRMMARVEGMPLEALETGVDWRWSTFGQFLDGLEGHTAVNAGFMVGHCAVRRWVLGDESNRPATVPEVDEMKVLLRQSLSAGGLGLSTSRSANHVDGGLNPVPSRGAEAEELLELCGVVGEYPGTTLEAVVQGCVDGFTPEEVDLLTAMSVTANRPLNWNILRVQASDRSATEQQLSAGPYARQKGGRIVALTLPVHEEMNMSFGRFCALWLLPGWMEILRLPEPDRTSKLSDPSVRACMLEQASSSRLSRYARFAEYVVGETVSPRNKVYEGRLVGEIADERGIDPFSMAIELAAEDGYDTTWWPLPIDDSDDDWQYRREIWQREDVLLGGSDAGAHLDRMLGSTYPTRFLADCIRGRQLVPVERAVELMTRRPAALFGLQGRGTIEVGKFADLVLFDPGGIASHPARRVFDLPGKSMRLTAGSEGIVQVFVNGVPTVRDGKVLGSTPGRVLRSGTDTYTVTAV